MTILKDDGLYRHIQVAEPNRCRYYFSIATFPGHLVFAGDMGTYVFSRIDDMFEFFRTPPCYEVPAVNEPYWSEKARFVDARNGKEEFDEESFKEVALRAFWNHDWPDNETRREAWESRIRRLIKEAYIDEFDAIQSMMDYHYVRSSEGFRRGIKETVRPFCDFHEYGPFTRPSFCLRWAFWAIAYTIRDYDLGGDRFTRQAKSDAKVLGRQI